MAEYKIGSISDIHAADVEYAVDTFIDEKVDFVLVNGDLLEVRNANTRKDDLSEVLDGLSRYDRGNIYVIPGNHDLVADYVPVMEEKTKEYSQILDLSDDTVHMEGEFSIIPYGGSEMRMWEESFLRNPAADINDIAKRFSDNSHRKIIFQTHDSPLMYGDAINSVQNVGNLDIAALLDGGLKNPHPYLSVSGHIHQNHIFDFPGKEIPTGSGVNEGEAVSNLALNSSAYVDGRFAVLESVDDKISYKIKRRK